MADLTGLKSLFSITQNQTDPRKPVILNLIPSDKNFKITDVVSSKVQLTWITKDVRFQNNTVESAFNIFPFDPSNLNSTMEGGMPVRVPAIGSLRTEELEGVPGQLAQLAGSVPIPIELQVNVSVRWIVTNERGEEIPEGPTTFTAPNGLDTSEVSLVFTPPIVEDNSDTSLQTITRYVYANVRLSAAGSSPVEFNIPEPIPNTPTGIPFVIPAIPIPKLAAFFLHPNFASGGEYGDGAVLIVVPNNSRLDNATAVMNTIHTLQSAISSLSAITELAAFFLGLTQLANALSVQTYTVFRKTDSINYLADITLIDRGVFGDDTEAEDELSSLIFIGPPGKKLSCSNERRNEIGEGQFELTVGPKLYVSVPTLHLSHPGTKPDGNEINIIKEPDNTPDHNFADLSSMRFL
ncbi:hypothetical protein O0550_21675 [Brevibacillus halotolerans]|uniref:hypothetical protein n=1 Tax=Brevibacillus TaxID=55080 RepID=UPI00215CB050|nr:MULTISPECIES: hypothetical protein [Brevibacillus]MCR8965782.1 hypothetical protein [Brevibacillus laterosporus]MCZ0837937.1 hypothetical protein [Brevibacillus halotolerans]